MSSITKSILALIGAAIIATAIYGAYQYPKALLAVGSPSGTTFNTAKIAAIDISPQSITSTSTSILNTDSSDRIVTDGFATCSGLTNMFGATAAGLATWKWYAATSTLPTPTISVADATFNAINMTVATATSDGYNATTTYTSAFARRWAAGTYMVFQTNGTSSTAVCNVGVHYLAL